MTPNPTTRIDLDALAAELEEAGWDVSMDGPVLTARRGHYRIEASPEYVNTWSDFGYWQQTPNPHSPAWQTALAIIGKHTNGATR